ncbi:hypothetical protein C1646_122769 [Rhizophagus diaphanus]|nr:hypothetical protein C1646_122769 [Rhizophagus diaphanus] [Rhizophagus sp. MUCL 43196]
METCPHLPENQCNLCFNCTSRNLAYINMDDPNNHFCTNCGFVFKINASSIRNQFTS